MTQPTQENSLARESKPAAQRISHSLLDPWLTGPLKGLYRRLDIPASFPPEGIVLTGHILAIFGAIGFALSGSHWWGGLLAALGVAGNHICDVLDGTHARATGQCRNGGELLDHFVDPLSFSYWTAGLAYCSGEPWFAAAGITVIYAMAVLTSIKAKMVGQFTLAHFGPTEFKTLLILFGIHQASSLVTSSGSKAGLAEAAMNRAWWFLLVLVVAGIIQLKISLWMAIKEVNSEDAEQPDTTEWEVR
ncbi:CDP-alcohol phosphatidyltransferase family protein [Adhaeretor mobilis]|uniref:CDP-alcohol phosphatidyltransferase n=1 Tax=Adhaeretor mobilis TaxID=1930276 RepID=A0A517MRX7_9BACT|nr:CDP-alcohol phosphatidyltransferase family protein [Adhaeretor mobilis]QDS97635.1 CDP-alcohol phosphatidyltransferase [Adhaeretor mobilis]